MNKAILNICPDEEYFGRDREIESIFRKALATGPASSIYMWGGRKSGKSEILKRAYHKLFWEQDRIVPFYYAVKADYSDLAGFAEDYLGAFVRQYLAFLKKDPLLVVEGQPLSRLERIVADEDVVGLVRLLATHREAKNDKDYNLILKNAVTAPHLMSLYYQPYYQTRVFVMVDDFHLLNDIRFSEGKTLVLNEYPELLRSQLAPHLITGSTSGMINNIFKRGELLDALDVMEVTNLDDEKAAEMLERLCQIHEIKYDKDTIDFAVRHLGGNPFYIKGMVRAGLKLGIGLASLRELMDIYTYEIMKGGTGLYLSSLLSSLLDGKERKGQLRTLHNSLGSGERGLGAEPGFRENELSCSLEEMQYTGDRVLADFVDAIYGMEIKGRSASQVRTEIAARRLKEGYSRHGSQAWIGIEEELGAVLESFNGQRVPKVVFQNHDFASRYNQKDAESGVTLADDEDPLMLPQMLGCFDDKEGTEKTGLHILEAHGFYNGRYEDGYESSWVAGLKDSIEAVTIDDVERFIARCDRLKERTRNATMVRWMVSKGGFTTEAQKALKAGGIFSSDHTQLRLLQRVIEEKGIDSTIAGLMPLREFELVIPMAPEAELVAARALEEVAKKAGFDEDTVSQLKMALVEACINAFEHSRVKNGKVSVSFFVEKERIVIYVKNEGKGFDVASVPKPDIDEKLTSHNKRGWGIELMKGLMDEIRFENIREGTKLIMVKYIKGKEDKNQLVKGLKVKQGRI